MLNTNINQKLEFHSVSGLMCKSHPKSIICKTEENPYLLDMDNPRKRDTTYTRYKDEPVVVLQVWRFYIPWAQRIHTLSRMGLWTLWRLL